MLLDIDVVPYIPTLYSAANPPLEGKIALYRSSPPLPEVECPEHLKPSAYCKTRVHHPQLDSGPDDLTSSSDNGPTLAELFGKSSKAGSQAKFSVPGGESIPPHPKGPRLQEK